MKKVFFVMFCIGLIIGLIVGINKNRLKEDEGDTEVNPVIEENYVAELKLPLIELDTLNPLFTNNKQVRDTLRLIYEPLIDLDENNSLVPALATNWMEKDDVTWIFKIRDNVNWHSGKSLSISDIVFTINSIKNDKSSTYYANVSNIANVSKIDDSSIEITLSERDKFLPYKLNFPIVAENNPKLIGTGAYKYVDTIDDEQCIVLEFNNNWWKSNNANLKKIYLYKFDSYGEAIKAFKSSEIDLISTSMSSWEKKFGNIGINSYSYENSNFQTIIPNTTKNGLNESSVRRAILYAINRINIIRDVYEGNACAKDIMIHEYSWAYDKDSIIEYSVEKSKQLLINAGWNQNQNGWHKDLNGKTTTLKFSLLVNKNEEDEIKVAEIIKENLNDLGIKINIEKVDKDTLKKNVIDGKFDLALATIELQNEYDIIDLFTSNNYARYSNDKLNEIFDKMYLENLNKENVFKELQNLYKQEIPYIGLYYKTDTLLTNKAVKGEIKPTWWNVYHNIKTWRK